MNTGCATMGRMAAKEKPRGMVGRHPTGIRPGEKVSDYKRLTVRLPDDVRAELDAAAGALKCPQGRGGVIPRSNLAQSFSEFCFFDRGAEHRGDRHRTEGPG